MRVLVVSEDVTERRRAISALALHADADVVEASSAEDARHRLIVGRERFDVLVVDGDMAPRGGFAVLYDLRARADQEGTDPVPSLVLTSREQDRWLAGWAGANDVLRKPVSPFVLSRRVLEVADDGVVPYGDAGSAAAQLAAATRDHG